MRFFHQPKVKNMYRWDTINEFDISASDIEFSNL